jgi:hypothetical protein
VDHQEHPQQMRMGWHLLRMPMPPPTQQQLMPLGASTPVDNTDISALGWPDSLGPSNKTNKSAVDNTTRHESLIDLQYLIFDWEKQ